ncbi:hypothetical protein [Halobacteriaceae bacterium SHR40]|uniref:hypothetical protein n=1 Tax=Halovenus amylolytica TaxID=2500550 RepID=UPI000FE38C1D
MDIRRRPGLLFLYVGVSLLALGSLLRRFVLPSTEYEFLLVSAGAFLATVLVTYALYDSTEATAETEWRY